MKQLVRFIAVVAIGYSFVELVRSAQAVLAADREDTAEFLAKLEPDACWHDDGTPACGAAQADVDELGGAGDALDR